MRRRRMRQTQMENLILRNAKQNKTKKRAKTKSLLFIYENKTSPSPPKKNSFSKSYF
jgi:hypothetical protein